MIRKSRIIIVNIRVQFLRLIEIKNESKEEEEKNMCKMAINIFMAVHLRLTSSHRSTCMAIHL